MPPKGAMQLHLQRYTTVTLRTCIFRPGGYMGPGLVTRSPRLIGCGATLGPSTASSPRRATPVKCNTLKHTHTHTHTRTHTTQHSTAHKAHRGVANYAAGAVDLNAVVPSMLFRILNYRPFSQPEPRGLKAATTGWQYGFWWSTGPLRELGSGKTWQR